MSGMTLQNRHLLELEKALNHQLGTTDEIRHQWENDPYPADGEVVTDFWNKIEKAKKIRIVGDYDCDGINSSFIMYKSIKTVYPEKQVSVRIPRRFSEGYGINDKIVDEIMNEMDTDESLIITVDNGIAAGTVLNRLSDNGYTVIVTDHHEAREGLELPKVNMLIDPAVKTIPNPLTGRYWCGAGVAYKLCEPIVSVKDEQVCHELSVYAGIATVADCMELKEGNWGLVRNAIKSFRDKTEPIALKNLLLSMGQDPDFCNEDHFGFYLGPAYNAPGRLLDNGATEVLKYLNHPTQERCEYLVELNNRRKEIRDEEYELIKQEIERTGQSDACPIWVAKDGLHEGIVGILAGKISEDYKRPAIVLTNVENNPGMLKGSARSYGKFNIFEYLSSMAELFARMGGHEGAAGLSMTEENFKIARTHQIDAATISESLVDDSYHTNIRQWEIPKINDTLSKFRPFGQGNPVPKFEIEVDINKDNARFIGEQKNHLLIQDARGKYKITHFFHEPNDLENELKFGMTGTISGSAFNGVETPTLNGEEIYDLIDERTLDREY